MLQGVVRTMIVIFIGRIPMLQGVVRTMIVIFIDRIVRTYVTGGRKDHDSYIYRQDAYVTGS